MHNYHKQLYDHYLLIIKSFLCFHTRYYPKNHYFSNHLPALQCKSLMIFTKKNYQKDMKHEIKRLSKRKNRERSTGAGRPFKLNARDRLLMLLVYYRLYITYTLTGFLFDLDQSNVCRDIQKIESLVRQCLPMPQKIYT